MNKLEHTGTGAFANSMLEVMRRCHVRFDVSASQFWIELPTTVQPGELNKDMFEHVENLRLVRFKGKNCVVSNWFCAKQRPWLHHPARNEMSSSVSVSTLLPLASHARRRVLRGEIPHENVEWPCFLCLTCRDAEMCGESKRNLGERLFSLGTKTLSVVMSASSLSRPTQKTLQYFMAVREFLPIPGHSAPFEISSPLQTERKGDVEKNSPLAVICVNIGEWTALVPPSQISDFLTKSADHLKQATSNATNLAAVSVPLEPEIALSVGIPSDIYGLKRWQQSLAAFCGVPLSKSQSKKADMFLSFTMGRGSFAMNTPFFPLSFNVKPLST